MRKTDSSIQGGLLYAFKHASQWGKWVVVVVPEDKHRAAIQEFAAVAPEEAVFSGRTARFGKGTVSVVAAGHPAINQGAPFSVLFLGWGGKKTDGASLMEWWRERAKETLSLTT